MKYCIGVDLGGTTVKVGFVNIENAEILVSGSIPTRAPRAAESVATDIVKLIRRLASDSGYAMEGALWIGVATAGIVKNGTVLAATNLGWNNVPLSMLLSRMTGMQVYLANDANAAAYAEALFGVGEGKSTLVALTLGTGVGGGIVINGKIFDGFNGFAAEMGHMIINSGGRECGCGKRGCLEAYASATALVKESRRVMNLYPDSKMWELVGHDADKVTAKTPFDAAKAGDYAALSVIDDFINNLAYGISNVINLFQPSVLCIGGGISAQGDALMIPLRDRVSRLSFGRKNIRTKVTVARFRNDAGIIGASMLGLQEKDKENMSIAEKISENFKIEGEVVCSVPYGNGHINDTFLITTRVNGGEKKYVLQRINKNVFKNPDLLMKNFALVTEHLAKKIKATGGDPKRETLNLIKTFEGSDYYESPEGDFWRMLVYVTGSKCYDKVEEPAQFYESAVAFGNFQRLLEDFPAETLHETIPNFHNTPDRFKNLMAEVERDSFGRLSEVMAEVEFARAREEFAGTLEREHAAGRLPLRVTHNDTKLNNILFDEQTDKPVCVVDLDTIMPGYSVNDFGDSIRFGASTAAEDERDLSLVNFDIGLYELYVKGFIEGTGNCLTEGELRMLPVGAIMMTLECGIRFLTDYLAGDTYFKTSRPKQNLDRCKTQFKLVSDMEANLDKMHEIVNKYAQK
ncbi:MAG: ROK family protein [Clostridia bacterium]|nr:ROK family protein [Clostridia bacterium]